jgi:hypothetical protein
MSLDNLLIQEIHKSRGLFKVCRDGRNPEGDVVVKRTRESSDKPLPDEWFTHRDRIRHNIL